MLRCNLLYTVIARARSLCVLSGNGKAIGMAVRNNKVAIVFQRCSLACKKYQQIDARLPDHFSKELEGLVVELLKDVS